MVRVTDARGNEVRLEQGKTETADDPVAAAPFFAEPENENEAGEPSDPNEIAHHESEPLESSDSSSFLITQTDESSTESELHLESPDQWASGTNHDVPQLDEEGESEFPLEARDSETVSLEDALMTPDNGTEAAVEDPEVEADRETDVDESIDQLAEDQAADWENVDEEAASDEVANEDKRVPIASDQRSYYDRHEWGRRNRRLDVAKALRLALPTIIVLPLVLTAVAFSGVDVGFYPFDGSLRLSSIGSPAPNTANGDSSTGDSLGNEDADDADDFDASENAGLNESGSSSRSPTTAMTSRGGVDTTLPVASEAASGGSMGNDLGDSATAGNPELAEPPVEGLADVNGDTPDEDAEGESDATPDDMDWLDDLVERTSDRSTDPSSSTTDATVPVEDIASETFDAPIENLPSESVPSENTLNENTLSEAEPSEAAGEFEMPALTDDAPLESAPSTSEPSVGDLASKTPSAEVQPVESVQSLEDAEEKAKRERDNITNALLVFPLEAPEPGDKKPVDDLAEPDLAQSELETPALQSPGLKQPEVAQSPAMEEDPDAGAVTDPPEVMAACEEALLAFNGLTTDSSGRDRAITYRSVAILGTLAFDPDSAAVSGLLGELAASDSLGLFKGLETFWAKSPRRDTEGILLVGRLRSNGETELWYETSGGDNIDVTAERGVPRDVRSVAIGRIVEVEPKLRVELVVGTEIE
ncbi:MAG: hypothetical protein AAFU85_02070 [Planctomycetota bacterium]